MEQLIKKENRVRGRWQEKHPEVVNSELEMLARSYNEEELHILPVEEVPEKKILEEGTSRDGKGRKKYLEVRCKKDPKERYAGMMMTSNMEYGWRVENVEYQAGKYNRSKMGL